MKKLVFSLLVLFFYGNVQSSAEPASVPASVAVRDKVLDCRRINLDGLGAPFSGDSTSLCFRLFLGGETEFNLERLLKNLLPDRLDSASCPRCEVGRGVCSHCPSSIKYVCSLLLLDKGERAYLVVSSDRKVYFLNKDFSPRDDWHVLSARKGGDFCREAYPSLPVAVVISCYTNKDA